MTVQEAIEAYRTAMQAERVADQECNAAKRVWNEAATKHLTARERLFDANRALDAAIAATIAP